MVEIEQRALPALEEHRSPFAQRAVDQQRRIGDIGTETLRESLEPLRQLLQLERLDAVHALEPDVLLGQRHFDLLAQDLGVENVLHANAEARRLVRVARADAAARRADLELAEPPFRCLVEGDVPGHDQVRLA